jgi:hypothetical protein
VSALYLYAIVDKPPKAPLGKLSVARAGGAHVVFERDGGRATTAANLKKHDRVVKRLARSCAAVLPFRFGSVVADRAALAALLEPMVPAIAEALEKVRDATQFTLRIYGKAAPPKRPKKGEGPGTRFMNARLRSHRVPEIEAVTAATKAFVLASRAQRHGRPPLLASVYHLVAQGDVRRYRAALTASSRELVGVQVEATGPWPPYAFAEVP